jgi:hypothetical protein
VDQHHDAVAARRRVVQLGLLLGIVAVGQHLHADMVAGRPAVPAAESTP